MTIHMLPRAVGKLSDDETALLANYRRMTPDFQGIMGIYAEELLKLQAEGLEPIRQVPMPCGVVVDFPGNRSGGRQGMK